MDKLPCNWVKFYLTATVTSQMMPKFGVRIKIQENNVKNAVLAFSIEFYNFW